MGVGRGSNARARVSASFFGPREWMLPLIVDVKQGAPISVSSAGAEPMPGLYLYASLFCGHKCDFQPNGVGNISHTRHGGDG